MTALGMWMHLNSQIYQRVHDVIISTSNGTTQIDHIILSIYGIFVIETKNYKGWIFGSPTEAKWCQSVFGNKNGFQNPLHQNYRHIKSLCEYLNLEEYFFKSVVFFIGDCEIKSNMPPNVMTRGLASYIKGFKDAILSPDQVANIKAKLESAKTSPAASKREHVQTLRSRINSTTECPKCGSALVTRVAKRGSNAGGTFLGCSAYPNCKYTKRL